MTTFIIIVMTIAAFISVSYPLFRQRLRLADFTGDEKLEELRSERDTTYSMLKELEFDYQTGILTEEDYKELELRYKRKAISTLRQLDSVGRSDKAGAVADIEDEIEKQVRKLRQSGGRAEPESQPQTRGKFCSQCGAEIQPEYQFCAACGTNLIEGGSID